MTQAEITAAAFTATGRPAKVTRLPSGLVRTIGQLITPVNPNAGANLQMFALMGQHDMVGHPVGNHHLADDFHDRLSSTDTAAATP